MAQPQFWLRVRKDYVMDNFSNLLSYLQKYEYRIGANNADFDDTLDCMREVADDLFAEINTAPLYTKIELPYDTPTILKLLSASTLGACKKGITDHIALTRIAIIIARENLITGTSHDNLMHIITSCIRNLRLNAFTINWNDINNEHYFLVGPFVEKFLRITFHDDPHMELTPSKEVRGLLLIPSQSVPVISLVNGDKYRNELKSGFTSQISVPGIMDFTVLKKDYEKIKDFQTLSKITSSILTSQSSFNGSVRKTLRAYQYEDTFIVKVTDKFGSLIKAETIDANYEQLSGKVRIGFQPPFQRPGEAYLRTRINVGDYLRVNISESSEFAFDTADTLESFYRGFARDCCGEVVSARYISSFKEGHIWISSDGIQIAVHNDQIKPMDEETYETYIHAIQNGLNINLKIADYVKPCGDKFFVYSKPWKIDNSIYSSDYISTESAFGNFFDAFLSDCGEEGDEIISRSSHLKYYDIQHEEYLIAILALLYNLTLKECGNASQRLQTACMAEFLANMIGRAKDAVYFSTLRKYICALVDFAANREINTFSMSEDLKNVEYCQKASSIIEILKTYKKKEILSFGMKPSLQKTDKIEVVAKLVDASNSLINIIEDVELNNIKQTIVKHLGVDDQYVSLLDHRTFYGTESLNLEFKTSVVFPPVNPMFQTRSSAQPLVQKWNIIKAVCGFLNSRSGGDLLIGVNDAGYPTSLEEDIRELFRLQYISLPNIDNYKNYIQVMLDRAFSRDKDGLTYATDICRSLVRVSVESNDEKVNIIRIKIQPSPTIVYLSSNDRPAEFKNSYFRDNGRTIALSDKLLPTVEEFKKNLH